MNYLFLIPLLALIFIWLRGIVFMFACYSAWKNVIVPFIPDNDLSGAFFSFNWATFSCLTWGSFLFGAFLILGTSDQMLRNVFAVETRRFLIEDCKLLETKTIVEIQQIVLLAMSVAFR